MSILRSEVSAKRRLLWPGEKVGFVPKWYNRALAPWPLI
jgi:hypothetical protein